MTREVRVVESIRKLERQGTSDIPPAGGYTLPTRTPLAVPVKSVQSTAKASAGSSPVAAWTDFAADVAPRTLRRASSSGIRPDSKAAAKATSGEALNVSAA